MLKVEQHCPSYYAASRNDHTIYSPLAGDHSTDVCVIGAGFTGTATALSLAERGYKVTVLEQNSVGWGASGRNGGQLIAGISGEARLLKYWGQEAADTFFEMGYRGHEIIEERIEKYNIDCDFKHGYIDVALKQRQVRDQHEWYEALCNRGMEDKLRLVEGQELHRLTGTSTYVGGLINMRNGHLHPLNLCLGEARAATGLGAVFHEGSPVSDIIHGKKPVVVTANGRVTCDFVVLAGNAYHRLEPRKLSGLVFPAGSYILATESLTEAEAAAVNPQDLAVCDQNEIVGYYRLSADRRLLFGGRCNYSGREPKDITAGMLPRFKSLYPQLANKRIDYSWGGKIGIVVNRVALLGRTADNVFYAGGYSGHGVNNTHLSGEIMADAVAGTLEKMEFFSKIPHWKIPFGQWFGGQAVAAGMLYYRMKDLF
ncbi:MAG: FAD-binding oxidoreductase [Gammaproteobacteria bacterium]|nr:FAD-binding oxidoreductase [Gammaproteobacteria bacterium]